jgi:Tfp pilus assembly protein PilV
MRKAFTLVEVAVAGGLIGVSVLAALAAIPVSLKMQNVARMRAVSAASVMYMVSNAETSSAWNSGGTKTVVTTSLLTAIPIQPIEDSMVGGDNQLGSDTVYYFSSSSLPSGSNEDLSRRIGFSFPAKVGNIQEIRTWMLLGDPTSGKREKIHYLSTFVTRDGI